MLDMHLLAVASSAVVANLRSIYDVTDEDLIIIPYAVRSQVRVAPDHCQLLLYQLIDYFLLATRENRGT